MTLEEAKKLKWGTYGKSGKEPLRWTTLGRCTSEHLKAILETQFQITDQYRQAIKMILERRESFA